jgi:excisionase family DNA binding protein
MNTPTPRPDDVPVSSQPPFRTHERRRRIIDPDAGMSLPEAAIVMGSSYTTIRELVKSGILDAYPVRPGSRQLRVTRRAIEEARTKLRVQYLNASGQSTSIQPVISNADGDTFLKSLFG